MLKNRYSMFKKYNSLSQLQAADKNLFQAFFTKDLKRDQARLSQKFLLEIDRADIMEECLSKIINMNYDKKKGQIDPLSLPIEVRFKNEPGIDEGGVRKEFY